MVTAVQIRNSTAFLNLYHLCIRIPSTILLARITYPGKNTKNTYTQDKTMFNGTLGIDSNRGEEESELPGCNFQNPKCTSHSTFSITKCFPNNYASLSGCREYKPNNKSMLMERSSNRYIECETSAKPSAYYPYPAETELRLASMRIFTTIMLNAWRRRREDVKRLLLRVEELKRGSQKAKTQIHVYNTLFRVEQKRNDDLACQLKCSLESVIQAKSSCENLNSNVHSLKAERTLLEQNLANKNKELEALSGILSQRKAELFQSMVEQRNLRHSLAKENRSVQVLENQKNKLINELYQLSKESRETEDKYRVELIRKEVDLERTMNKVKLLEAELTDLKEKSRRIDESIINNARLHHDVENLQKRLDTLQQVLDGTFGRRVSDYWQKICFYQQKGFHFAQIFLYWLLPAVPLPGTFPNFQNKQNLVIGIPLLDLS
ncbi:cingulin-like isoform X1 [Anastrepha ludens]|uniref:cingulin-like isoform X1 n=2 Tax=Anastrepha ludens TaxID=28586 RepID=UPI0023B01D1E|nr:cingulin-like isoform X1 [Anastrepha ludens]